MKLLIQSPSPDISQSQKFYDDLGFKTELSGSNLKVWDRDVALLVNGDRTARAGIRLYAENWVEVKEKLKAITHVHESKQGTVLSDGSGQWLYLCKNEDQLPHEPDPNASASHLGTFAGLSVESLDMEHSMKVWEILGFSKTMGSPESGWVVMTNDTGFGISIMKPFSCPHLFYNPSLTYFNGSNNLNVIQKVRELKIPITEEITHFNKEGKVDNLIVQDPGGLGFLLFSDG